MKTMGNGSEKQRSCDLILGFNWISLDTLWDLNLFTILQ